MKYKSTILLFSLLLNSFAFTAHAQVETDSLIKCDDFTSVYYLADDGMRYVFQNEKAFFTWYENFDDVVNISCDELGDIAIGGVVHYQPGTRLVKIQSVPDVYAVESGGKLRKIKDEQQAEDLYGKDWAKRIDDLNDSFFPQYEIGEELGDKEIPEGTILEDEDKSLYRVNDNGEAVGIDNLIEEGFGTVLEKFSIPLERVEANLGIEVALTRAADAAQDALERVREKLMAK